MLLTYSIGNDDISIGFIEDGSLCGTASVSTDTRRTADEYAFIFKSLFNFRGISIESIEGAIGASVVPQLTETVRDAFEKLLSIRPHILGAGTKTGLNILTDDPTQLGADLVASAVGALAKYTPPLILIDFGTATTFSVIDKNGAFVGCAIAPGVSMSEKALTNGASLLPSFANAIPKKCVGTNTMESMQSGCIIGSAAMIDGMIGRIEAETGESAMTVASGGTADIILPLCERHIHRDDTLLLMGLFEIYKKNLKRHGKQSAN